MILIIDNYDSFTYNLYQQVLSFTSEVKVIENDQITLDQIKKLNPKRIIISPGPKRPEDAGISNEIIKEFHKEIPILGVCLGHECIGQIFGSEVIHAPKIFHGKTSKIKHNDSKLLKGLKNPFKAARYHSLILKETPKDFHLTGWTNDNEIMAIEHQNHPLYGIQFHPESFLTPEGDKIIKNFIDG